MFLKAERGKFGIHTSRQGAAAKNRSSCNGVERWIKEAADEAAAPRRPCAAFPMRIARKIAAPSKCRVLEGAASGAHGVDRVGDQDRDANGDEESYQQPSDHVRLQRWS